MLKFDSKNVCRLLFIFYVNILLSHKVAISSTLF